MRLYNAPVRFTASSTLAGSRGLATDAAVSSTPGAEVVAAPIGIVIDTNAMAGNGLVRLDVNL